MSCFRIASKMSACDGQRGVAHRLENTVLQIGEGIVCSQGREVRHRERAVELAKIGLGQVEKFEEQIREVARAISFHLQANSVTRLDRRNSCSILRRRLSASSSST